MQCNAVQCNASLNYCRSRCFCCETCQDKDFVCNRLCMAPFRLSIFPRVLAPAVKTDFASSFTAVHGMNTAHTDTSPHFNFLTLRYSGQITKSALLRLEPFPTTFHPCEFACRRPQTEYITNFIAHLCPPGRQLGCFACAACAWAASKSNSKVGRPCAPCF
jgi:hypothetical protein